MPFSIDKLICDAIGPSEVIDLAGATSYCWKAAVGVKPIFASSLLH